MESVVELASSKPERFTKIIQAKLTPSEARELDRFVEFCRAQGMTVTRSSAVRAFVQSGLRAVGEELSRAG